MPEVVVSDSMHVAESPSDQSDVKMEKVQDSEVKFEGQEKTEEVVTATDTTEIKEDEKSEEKKEEEWLDVLGSGHIKMKVIQKGRPNTRPTPPEVCTIKYIGKLEDGTIVEQNDCLEIQVGHNEVIQGLDIALPLMEIGEETIVVVGPRFAYGSMGLSPNIPPGATITYVVKLIMVQEEPALDQIPFEKRINSANAKRERGNWWYSRQDPTKAIQCYRKALDILSDNTPYVDEAGNTTESPKDVVMQCFDLRLKVYNNLAAAQLMSQAYSSALDSVDIVIQCEPNNVKALFRKGKILTAKGCINDAVDVLKHALSLEPENSAIRSELNRSMKIQQQEKQHEKNLYKKMLGQDKKQEKIAPMPRQGKRGSWTKIVGTAATATVMAAIAVTVGYRYKNYTFL